MLKAHILIADLVVIGLIVGLFYWLMPEPNWYFTVVADHAAAAKFFSIIPLSITANHLLYGDKGPGDLAFEAIVRGVIWLLLPTLAVCHGLYAMVEFTVRLRAILTGRLCLARYWRPLELK